MNALSSVLAALLLAPAAALAGEAPAKSPDRAAIEAAVFDYFHGQGEASIERLNRAFDADNATMVGVVRNDDGSESVRAWKDMNEVLARWAANQNPPGGARDGEILDVRILDGRLAAVAFRYMDRFSDALILAKADGRWKIVAKAFVGQ